MRNLALAIAATTVLALTAGEAAAQARCRVMDPTGTPLNVRTGPNGRVVGEIDNGALVTIYDRTTDARGRPWVYVGRYSDGRAMGWVYREFIACF